MGSEEVLARLSKETMDRLKLGSDIKTEYIETPSAGLNRALGGGIGKGRLTTIYGTKSAGKTAFCLQTMAAVQRAGGTAALIDAEKSYSKEWGEKLGIDNDRLLVTQHSDMEAAGDMASDFCKAGADILVIDSGSSLIQPSFFDKSTKNASMENTRQIGSFSKGLKALLRIATYYNDSVAIIMIMQESMQSAGMYWVPKAEGGQAIEYYSSQMIRLKSNNSSDLITGTLKSGEHNLERKIGRTVHWEVAFNKMGPQGVTGDYEFYFLGDKVGVDDRLELLRLGVEYGLISKSGAWFKTTLAGEEVTIQGESKFVEMLGENTEAYEELRANVQSIL